MQGLRGSCEFAGRSFWLPVKDDSRSHTKIQPALAANRQKTNLTPSCTWRGPPKRAVVGPNNAYAAVATGAAGVP